MGNSNANSLKKKIGLMLFSAFIFLISLEVSIRFSGLYSQLSEKNGHGFLSLYNPTHRGIFQNYAAFDTIQIINKEFSFNHSIDQYGFRNNTSDSIKIVDLLALGDSFTEGLGAHQDSSWPSVLAHKNAWVVYNAGVMGSDPVYGFKILKDNTFNFAFRRVAFVINFSDVTDLVIRGGEERFTIEGEVRYRKEPWFMPLYKQSHLFRAALHLIFNYDYMFNSPAERNMEIEKALSIMQQTLVAANEYCAQKGIRLYVFVHPIPQEYYKNLDRRLDFKQIDRLVDLLRAKNINAFNLRSGFEAKLKTSSDWQNASWPIDGHFNSIGYAIMAELIAEALATDSTSMVD